MDTDGCLTVWIGCGVRVLDGVHIKKNIILGACSICNKSLLEEGVIKLKSFGTGKFGRVLGEIFVDPEIVGEHINECIENDDSDIDLDHDGWVSVNDILIEEGHAYEYYGGKKKDFEAEMAKEKEASFGDKK